MFRLCTALLVLVAVSSVAAPALAQPTVCTLALEGQACTDGNPCTRDDTCHDSACGGILGLFCEADQCHSAGICLDGENCIAVPLGDGTDCDDGNPCTTNDECIGGTCSGAGCDDGDACTDDACTPTGCTHTAKPGCIACGGGRPACNDGEVCTTDTCVAGVCTFTNNTASCSDGDACTLSDVCHDGVCTSGTPKTCTASDQCHAAGTCNPANGVCSNPNQPDDTTCTDGNACTHGDSCQAGVCTPATSTTCTAPNECHIAGTCNPTNGLCSVETRPDDTTCSDGNACTLGDKCVAGTCSPGTPKACTASDQCHNAGTCNPTSGVCSNPTKPNDSTCSDGNACTLGDTCQGGNCTAGTPKTCTAFDQCHGVGVCNTTTGNCTNPSVPNNTPCNDGNGCTENDTCQAAICTAGTPRTCNDDNACTTDSCSAGACVNAPKGNCTPCGPGLPACSDGNTCTTDTCEAGVCVFTNNTAACSDGDACTTGDTCHDGICTSGTPKTCTALDQCHTAGTCDAGTGLCSNPTKPNDATCSDGNACTQGDSCQAGTCTAGTPKTCTALDQCHTAGTCDGGTGLCSNPPKPNDASCSDGNACTLIDTCQAGTCTPGAPKTCSALDQCHLAGTCDTATGACSNPAKPNDSTCSDGNACTVADTCQGGSCTAGMPKTCPALDQCHTAGTCDVGTGTCSNPAKPNDATCSDGNACTQGDTCQGGSCTAGTPKTCTAFDQCHGVGVCNTTTGNCTNPSVPNNTPCNDGNGCTENDTCQAAVCTAGTPKTCNDDDACTVDSCSGGTCTNGPKSGCVSCGAGLPACDDGNACTADACTDGVCIFTNTSGGSCSDGDQCTTDDVCHDGVCTPGTPKTCTASDQCHDAGVCNPGDGVCSNPPKTNGTTCSDGSQCTQGDTCQAGLCTPGTATVCAALDQCHTAGTCNPADGVCSNPPKPNDATCSDGNACTVTDTCQAGACTPGTPKTCTALDQCHTAGTCNPSDGVCSNPPAPNDSTCSDGNACTQNDTCQAGACVPGAGKTCTALDQCHDAGTCAPATGICSNPAKPNDVACSDGNACTQSDTCQAGTCTPGTPKTCTALDQCHAAGICNTQNGVCSNPTAPDTTPCNDGDGCTVSDTCQAGTCTAGPPRACNDGEDCTADSCSEGECVNRPVSGCIACGAGLPACDDAIVCTTDTCESSKCQFTNNTLGCDDANPCTTASVCQGGNCVGTADVVCQPSDQCHEAGTCVRATGLCSVGPTRANGTPCDDGDDCSLADACAAGVCAPGTPRDCNDGIPCTDDGCSGGACVNTPIDTRCVPGDCLSGRCDPTAPSANTSGCVADPLPFGTACTDDAVACTEDVCTANGCEHRPVDDRCTPAGECANAACRPALGSADAAGCVDVPGSPDGTECSEDGDPCTNDVCTTADCTHALAGEVTSCRPVEGPYRRARALLEFVQGLRALVSASVTPDQTGGPGSRTALLQRLDGVELDLEVAVRMLAGKVALPATSPLARAARPSPVLLDGTIAQQRGRIAFTQVKDTPAEVRAFLNLLALAKRRAELSAPVARDLRGRGRSLLAGSKALKRDLKRLQRLNQVFAR